MARARQTWLSMANPQKGIAGVLLGEVVWLAANCKKVDVITNASGRLEIVAVLGLSHWGPKQKWSQQRKRQAAAAAAAAAAVADAVAALAEHVAALTGAALTGTAAGLLVAAVQSVDASAEKDCH